MINLFNKNQSLNLAATIIVLIIFISVAVLYNFSIAKQVEAGLFGGGGFGGSIFSGVFKGVREAILDIVQDVISLVVDFAIENKELIMAAAIAWKWWTQPADASAGVFDTVKSLAMHTMLSLITMDIIREIQGEEPRYIDNWDEFFEKVVDDVGGAFIDQYLGAGYLCEPFDLDIKMALLEEYTFAEEVECTLSDIAANIRDFYEDFSQGNWEGWVSLTTPKHHFAGAYILAEASKLEEEEEARETASQEALAGRGFLSLKSCIQGHLIADDTGETIDTCSSKEACESLEESASSFTTFVCDNEKTETPGSVVSDMASNILSQPIDLLTGLTKDIASALPSEYQQYLQAILSAYFNMILKESMNALLGRESSTDYNSAVSEAFDESDTSESIELESAGIEALLTVLENVKTKIDQTTTVLGTIKSTGESILTSSVNHLFTTEPISSLPSYESYTTYTPEPTAEVPNPPQEITLTASGVGQTFFYRTVVHTPGPEEENYANVLIDSISVEISSYQTLYNSADDAWDTAYAQASACVAAYEAWQAAPSDAALEAAVETEESEALPAINNLLGLWGIEATDMEIDVLIKLYDLQSILTDKLGENYYDPGLSASDYDEPFLSSYYYKYYYDLVPKEDELDEIINPPEEPGGGW